MTRQQTLRPEFVEFVPEQLEPGILYISMRYKSVAHLCCCGCGHKVVTPLSPTGWRVTYNGKAISLSPSVGNWKLKCQSHYWIEDNQIEWAEGWTQSQIERGYARDQQAKVAYFQKHQSETDIKAEPPPAPQAEGVRKRLQRWWNARARRLS